MSSDRLFVHTSRAHIRTSHRFGVARLIRKCFSLFRPRSSSHSAVRFDTVRPPQTRSHQLRSSLFRVRTPSSCPYTSAVASRRGAGYCDRRVCLSVRVSPLAYPPPDISLPEFAKFSAYALSVAAARSFSGDSAIYVMLYFRFRG